LNLSLIFGSIQNKIGFVFTCLENKNKTIKKNPNPSSLDPLFFPLAFFFFPPVA
jgi:hypothetical protein